MMKSNMPIHMDRLFAIDLKSLTIQLLYALILVGVFVSVIHPDVRATVRNLIDHDFRRVLSTVTGDLRGDGSLIKVVKVKTRDSLYLEFYSAEEGKHSELLQRIRMNDRRDAFFNYNGQMTNLILANIDGGADKQILAPSYDTDLRAHLNIFRFDPGINGFSRVLQN